MMTRSRWLLVVIGALLLGALPALAHACPVCFSGSAKLRAAFFNTTVLLSLTPLGMIGFGLMWLRRSGRFKGEFQVRDAYPPAPVADEDEELA